MFLIITMSKAWKVEYRHFLKWLSGRFADYVATNIRIYNYFIQLYVTYIVTDKDRFFKGLKETVLAKNSNKGHTCVRNGCWYVIQFHIVSRLQRHVRYTLDNKHRLPWKLRVKKKYLQFEVIFETEIAKNFASTLVTHDNSTAKNSFDVIKIVRILELHYLQICKLTYVSYQYVTLPKAP